MVECIPFLQKAVPNTNLATISLKDLAGTMYVCEWEPISVLTVVIVILFFIGLWAYLKKKK